MPRYRVSLERPVNECRSVVVEAESEDAAKAFALSEPFDEAELDDWTPMDRGDPKVCDCEQVDDDEPLTPLDPVAIRSADPASLIALGSWTALTAVEFHCRIAWANAARNFAKAGRIG
jgi:hypothetical protein